MRHMELFKLYGEIAIDGGTHAVRQLRSIDEAGQRAGGVLKSLAMQAVGVAAGFGLWTSVSAAVNGLKNLGQQAVMLNTSLEQSQVAFATFLKSAKEGNAFIEEMRRFAAKTPFQYTELEQYAKRLLAFKFEAQEILPMMTAIGNAAAGLGGGAEVIGRITLALGQMKVKGRVMSEEMLQLTEAGIGAWDILAKGIGKSTAETQKLVQQGLVPADQAIKILTDGMNEQFDNMMEKQSQTMQGLWSTVQDIGEMVLTDVGEGVFGELKKAVSGIAGTLEELQSSGQLRQWAQGLGESLGRLAAMLGTTAKVGAGALTSFLAWKAITGIPAVIEMVTGAMLAFRGAMVATAAVGMNFWTAMKIATGGQAAAYAFVTAGRSVAGFAAQQRAAAAASVALAQAQNMVKAALLSTGIGAIVIALGALVTHLMMAKTANEKFIDSIEKETKARDGTRTQLEAELSLRESEQKQLEELKARYVETDNALKAAKKGSEEATVAKAKLAKMTQELIPIIGEEGAEHIRSATDSAKAFDSELKAKASQVTQMKGKIEEAVRADANHTLNKIQATQQRIEALKSETKAYGLWANMLVWAYNRMADINRGAAVIARALGMHKEADIYSQGADYWDEKAANKAAASREAELDKLYDQLGRLNSRYRDLSSYSLEAGKAVESIGTSATSGMQKAGKASKATAEDVGRAWNSAGQKIESAMSGAAFLVGSKSERAALEYKNRLEEIIEELTNLTKMGANTEPVIQLLQNALKQVDNTVQTGSKTSWTTLLEALKQALTQTNNMVQEEARQTSRAIQAAYQQAFLGAQEAMENFLAAVRRQQIESLNTLHNLLGKAIRANVEAEKKAALDSLNNDIAIEDQRVRAKLASIEKVKNARVKALNEELRAMQEAEDEREREAQDAEANQRIAELRVQVEEARTFAERESAQQALAEAIASNEERLRKRQVNAAMEAKRAEISAVEEAYEADRRAIEDSFADFKSKKEERIKYLEEMYYPELLDQARINAQAEQLIVAKNQEEMLRLLMGYKEGYADVGKSFGESLLGGATPYINQFQELIQNALGITLPTTSTLTADQKTAMANAENLRAFLRNAGYSQGAADISSYNAAGAKQWYDTYIKDRTDLTSEVKEAFWGIVLAKQQYERSENTAGTVNTKSGGKSSGGGQGVSTSGTYTMGTDAGRAIYDDVAKNGGQRTTSDGTVITKDSSGKVIAVTKSGKILEVKKKHEGGVVGRNLGTPTQDFLKSVLKLQRDESLNILQIGEEVIPRSLVDAFRSLKLSETGFKMPTMALAGGSVNNSRGIFIDVHDNVFKDGTDLGAKLELALRRVGI